MKRCHVSHRIKRAMLSKFRHTFLKDETLSKNILINVDQYIEYENDNFILINKPSGIAVHSGTNQKADFLSSLRTVLKIMNFL